MPWLFLNLMWTIAKSPVTCPWSKATYNRHFRMYSYWTQCPASTPLSLCLTIHLSIHSSIYLPTYLCLPVSVCLSVSPSIYLSTYQSDYLSPIIYFLLTLGKHYGVRSCSLPCISESSPLFVSTCPMPWLMRRLGPAIPSENSSGLWNLQTEGKFTKNFRVTSSHQAFSSQLHIFLHMTVLHIFEDGCPDCPNFSCPASHRWTLQLTTPDLNTLFQISMLLLAGSDGNCS